MLPIHKRLSEPALNRWLQVYPVVWVVLLLCSIHRLFQRAFLSISGAAARATPQAGFDDEGARAPENADDYRRQEGKRKYKMRCFLQHPRNMVKLVLWLSFAHSMMHIHHSLFKSGSLHGDPQGGHNELFSCLKFKVDHDHHHHDHDHDDEDDDCHHHHHYHHHEHEGAAVRSCDHHPEGAAPRAVIHNFERVLYRWQSYLRWAFALTQHLHVIMSSGVWRSSYWGL